MTERSTSDWVGKRLRDRYQIRQELGKAVGRRTLLADDLQEQRPVVIKLLTFGADFEWANLKLFEREGEVLKSLDHPGIPSYLDYFEIDSPQAKGYALVQSYVEGKSLQDQLQAGRTFNEVAVIDIAQQLLAILQYLHSQTPPIIHRDLKPSNILLSDRSAHSQGQLYLVDFGSVQAPFFQPTGTLTIVGTYGYMPPEQFGGRAEPASDLYSLGATLIYLVTGLHPADLPQQNLRIRFEDKATHISHPLRQWLRWLITPEIAKRPASATEALEGLSRLQETGSLSILPSGQLSHNRIMVSQREGQLEIVVPPKGFQPKEGKSWFDLLVLGIIFSFASSITGSIIWIPFTVLGAIFSLFFIGMPVVWLVSSAISVAAGLIAITLLPTPASNHLLRQLHFRLDDHELIIYREPTVLIKLRRVLFKVKRGKIDFLALGRDQNILRICSSRNYSLYRLDRRKLGLTTTEFKWLAQELSDGLGVSLNI
ncbi:MAG: serine/threonine-protein kinase [Leptolyngbyaceae cyanobacterium MO_188.B28]|nr:serine/threonine-protein kinase [Leptolyngbyaceae cyanobacterium MO_188.B28]